MQRRLWSIPCLFGGAELALLLVIGACGRSSGPESLVVRQDSSGIRLTMAEGPESADSVSWPSILVVGEEGAGPEYRFDGIAGMILHPDGSLVVANGGTQDIRFFGPGGDFIRSVGRAGSGPGEFSPTIELFPYRNDSLMVWDFTRRQLTILDRDGRLGRTLAITTAEPNPTIVGAYFDGSLLVGSRYLRLAPGANTDSVVFQRISPDGLPREVLGWFRTAVVHLLTTDFGPVVDHHPFFPRAEVVVAEGGFVVAPGDKAVLQQIDPTGLLVAENRWALMPTPLDPGAVAAWKQEDLANQRSEIARAQRRGWLDDLSIPGEAPVVAGLRIATDGTRWVRRFNLGHSAVRFDLMAPDGRWLRTVTLPAGFELLAATATTAAGILRDAEGGERVVVYRRPVP